MTAPAFLGLEFSPAIAAQLLRSRRGVRRLVNVGRQLWYVTLNDRGLELRQHRHRFTMALTWSDVLKLAEHRAGDLARREQLAQAADRRIARRVGR